MANILGKLKDIIGGGNQDYQYYEEEINQEMTEQNMTKLYEEAIPLEEEEKPTSSSRHKSRLRNREKSNFPLDLPSESSLTNDTMSNNLPNNVIEMPGIENPMNEVVVIEPHSFDEIPRVIQTLRERRCVVLNLNVMDPDEAQRAVDFVAGGTYAIDGHQERIGESIFLFTPKSVKVSTLTGGSYNNKESVSHQSRTSLSESLWDDHNTQMAQ